MSPRTSVPFLAILLACLARAPLLSAREPGYPETVALGSAVLAIKVPPTGFMWLAVASEPEGGHDRPIVCFGLRPVRDAYAYTYFIVFKTDRTEEWDSVCSVNDGASGFFDVEATLEKVQLSVGDGPNAKKVTLSYRAAWDKMTGDLTRESLSIDGEPYEKDGPRVFLCDLTAGRIVCKPLKVALPRKAPMIDSDAETMSATLIQSLRDVAAGSPEVRAIFEGTPER